MNKIFASVITIALAAVCATGCADSGQAAAKEKASPARAAVAVARVERHDLARELELAAEFRPYQEIELHAKVSGYLKSIHVDVGDHVRRGQLLAVLEVPEMAQELAQAQSMVKRSTLDVERARGELRRAESNLRIRKLSYDRLLGVDAARPNLIAQQEIDDAAARFHDAEAQLMAARASLAVTEEQVQSATAGSSRMRTMIDYLRITAPFAGVITQRQGDPGALIQAGTASQTQAMPVVRLSQVDRLRLVLPVPESVVPRIRAGTPVEVRVDSLNQVFQGRVSRFSGRLDTATRTMETEVDIRNAGNMIKPGMYGYAALRMDRRENAIAAPVQAVSGHGTNATVMVVNSAQRLEERKIQTGIETPERIEVLAGLADGELVVLGNRSRLKPGAEVRPKLVDRSSGVRAH